MVNLLKTEFEAKFYPIDKDQYRKRIKELGATLTIPERKMDRIIADARANPNLPKNSFIRVRSEGEIVRLSFKVSAVEGGKLDDQKEVDTEVSDFDKTVEILESTGLVFNLRQETLREEWEYKGAQITIDTWPGLLSYIEIEAVSEEKVKEIARDFGLNWDTKIITAIAEVYEKVYGISIEEVLIKISSITFENNPFEKMKKVWEPKVQ